MPKYTNEFQNPEYSEETILDSNKEVIGTIRIKPSSVMWKPSGKHKFLAVPLDKFTAWIADKATGATEVKK